MNEYRMPRRILLEKNTENTGNLFEERDLQVIYGGYDDKSQYAHIEKGGFILLDFGKELCGGIEMAIQSIGDGKDSTRCRLVFGESVMEALSEIGVKNATNDHAIRDMTVEVHSLSFQRYANTGFRFVKIEPLEAGIYIKAIRAVNEIEDFEYKGSFRCSDSLLNKIWETGAYTVHLNTHEYIWDGVKRDRLIWTGDMEPEVSALRTVFGNVPAIKRSLDMAKQCSPSAQWMNKTATYSMWWMVIHYEMYMHWGNHKYLSEQEEYMTLLCDRIFSWADSGFEAKLNEITGFVDWSSKYSEDEVEGRKAVTCIALMCAEKIFGYLDNEEYRRKCAKYLEKIRCDKPERKTNKGISALTVIGRRDAAYAREVLAGGNAEDMTCFLGYYVLIAKAILGEYKEALDVIRGYWGAMLDAGATTFWEDFDVKWLEDSAGIDCVVPEGKKCVHGDFGKHCYEGFRMSLCHGWAGGPTPFLSEKIGGIEILEPGCKKVKICPNLGDLEWIDVKYPTPYGLISIFAQKVNGEVVTKIDAPQPIEIVA